MHGVRLVLLNSDDCEPETGTVLAEVWSSGAWVVESITLPDVIFYDTVPQRRHHHDIDRWLQDNARVVHDRVPNKLELPLLLSATSLARYVIPQATLDPEQPARDIEAWLIEHGDCVIKATTGHRGHGIWRLHAQSNGAWQVRKDDDVLLFDTATEAATHVAVQIAGRLRYRSFIVQRYINSTSLDGRAADIRVHLQRGGTGAWSLTRSYVRLGEAGRAVSNISRGGYQGPLESFLSTRQLRSVADLSSEIEAAAFGVVEAIEAKYESTLSEIGVDLAIDLQDRLWLIEANACPGTSLHESDRAFHTIAYALYLILTRRSERSSLTFRKFEAETMN